MGGGQKVVNPTPPAPVSAGQSAADYAKALPQILAAQLAYQPQFDQASFDAFAQLAPEYARINQQVLEQYQPTQAALGEQLAKQALDGSVNGLPTDLRNQYLNDYKALVTPNLGSGLAANYVANNLLGQDLAYRQYNQNLGLSLQNKVPISTAFQNPSQFQVANSFQSAFDTAQSGQNAFIGGSRPFTIQQPDRLGQIGQILGGVGGAFTGIGAFKTAFS